MGEVALAWASRKGCCMTFSVAALCSRTGEIGFALATSSMAVGARAAFLAPGFGVVFAQGRSDPQLGALGLALLETGRTAVEALAEMRAATPYAAFRQIAVLDNIGRIAHATGEHCLPPCGAAIGRAAIALGNAVANDTVVPAMLDAFNAAEGSLANRLLTALEAGVAAGGEPYPLRSAALKVARPDLPFAAVDLRVDLAEHPVAALRHHWQVYEPLMEGYALRAVDPSRAPLAAAMESELRHWPIVVKG